MKFLRIIIHSSCLLFLMFAGSACSRDQSESPATDIGYLLLDDVFTRSYEGTHPGDDPEDYWVYTIRVLAFDRTAGRVCESNELYHFVSAGEESIRHNIAPGTYDFVFIANEPSLLDIRTRLNGIAGYADLNSVAFPARFFQDDNPLPMMREVSNVEIREGSVVVDGTVSPSLEVGLRRLGVRVDVTLKAEDVLDPDFTGVTFSNLPDVVPLTAGYTGTIARDGVYQVKADKFSDNIHSASSPSDEGMAWERSATRILLPSCEFSPRGDEGKSVVLTVNIPNKYSPYTSLQIVDGDYTLPRNTKLDFTAKVRMPLDVNIRASDWNREDIDWDITPRKLSVTHSEVSITDYNGVRIGFTSNMPVVRVLDVVQKTSGDGAPKSMETNYVFNSLVKDGTNLPARFSYNAASGSGYMDIIVDQLNETRSAYDGDLFMSYPGEYTFKLILSAEETDGSNALRKEITVNVSQKGYRFDFTTRNGTPWGYCGAFFRNAETGERIITGNYRRDERWTATVIAGAEWLTISSTPSFDPAVGTDSPGKAEHYKVTANSQKGEDGSIVTGRGRIYFRVGTKGANTTGNPRYGVIRLDYYEPNEGWLTGATGYKIYVRQGEDEDYIFGGPGDPTTGARAAARKFSPYNVTHANFKPAATPAGAALYPQVGIAIQDGKTYGTNSDFVDYPTQSGALFSWGIDVSSSGPAAAYRRRALYPTNWSGITNVGYELWGSIPGNAALPNGIYWNTYQAHFEVCPKGYHRPSDGVTNAIAVNSTSAQIQSSEWRMSLFKSPMTGDGNSGVTSNKYTPKKLDEITYGAYADGFFDRRPIQPQTLIAGDQYNLVYYGVALNTAAAANIGALFHNDGTNGTNASVFFPSAGRRQPTTTDMVGNLLEYKSSGYYLSSSLAPVTTTTLSGNVWSMEINFNATAPVSVVHTYAYSLRCVRDQ